MTSVLNMSGPYSQSHKLELLFLQASIIYKVKGSKNQIERSNKHCWISQLSVCDREVQRRFGSGFCGHVSVWWFSSLWRSVSWNDYAEGLAVYTLTHLLSTLPPPSKPPTPQSHLRNVRTGTLAKTNFLVVVLVNFLIMNHFKYEITYGLYVRCVVGPSELFF